MIHSFIASQGTDFFAVVRNNSSQPATSSSSGGASSYTAPPAGRVSTSTTAKSDVPWAEAKQGETA
jgi:hypothetical protein